MFICKIETLYLTFATLFLTIATLFFMFTTLFLTIVALFLMFTYLFLTIATLELTMVTILKIVIFCDCNYFSQLWFCISELQLYFSQSGLSQLQLFSENCICNFISHKLCSQNCEKKISHN